MIEISIGLNNKLLSAHMDLRQGNIRQQFNEMGEPNEWLNYRTMYNKFEKSK